MTSDGAPGDRSFARVATGVQGLDDILLGGLPQHGVYLLKGGPGSGKTTLALQFVLEGVARGETCLFVSLSQSMRMLHRIASAHGLSLEQVHVHAITPGEILQQLRDKQDIFVSDEVELIDVADRIRRLIADVRPSRIVFDSLNFVEMLATLPGRYEQELAALVELLGNEGITGLFILSGTGPVSSDMIMDGTIELQHLSQDFAGTRYRLTVRKMRGSDFQGGEHDFEIVRGGLVVYPRLALAELPPREVAPGDDGARFVSGIEGLDRQVGGGISRRTSCLLVGPSGTGKTSLATRYAFEAAERGHSVAYFIFEERRETMLGRAADLRMDLRPHIDAKRMEVREVGGSTVLPGELAAMIRGRVEAGVELVVIDSLSGYYQSLPDKALVLAQTRDLVRYLGDCGVVTLLTLDLGKSMEFDVSESIDILVDLRFIEDQGRLKKSVAVVKRRDGLHESGMRELVIDAEHGLRIGDRFGRFEGRMTGQPMITAAEPAAPERSDDGA